MIDLFALGFFSFYAIESMEKEPHENCIGYSHGAWKIQETSDNNARDINKPSLSFYLTDFQRREYLVY